MRRRTWLTGGVLLLASAFLGLMRTQLVGTMLLDRVSIVLFASALVIFAIGFGASGSVVARRPLGMTALLALAAWQVLDPFFRSMVAPSAIEADFEFLAMLSTLSQVLSLILAVIAVWQVGRAAVLPRPWNWAPLWALATVVAARVLMDLVAGGVRDQTVLVLMYVLAAAVLLAANIFLGVLAIVLALRPERPEPVRVYPTP